MQGPWPMSKAPAGVFYLHDCEPCKENIHQTEDLSCPNGLSRPARRAKPTPQTGKAGPAEGMGSGADCLRLFATGPSSIVT
jgi:hypothetical protein